MSVDEKPKTRNLLQLKQRSPYSGGSKAIARLRALNFDPIGELVLKYRKLEDELKRQEDIRSGVIVELTPTGRPRSYNEENHLAIYDKLTTVAEKLLRYRYGRVPETGVEEAPRAPALIVNLTQQGETYVVNDYKEDDDVIDVEEPDD